MGGGLFEMRVHHGPGYRVYYLRERSTLVLLCGGDKVSQQRDIERAGRLAEEWRQT
ncbi:MAG: addiction module killer protein [Gammaproteobacteria bacterium]|nr:addiction module killer protein [Gammaproteobacteria bacterium]